MQTKLTLRMDDALIRRIKRFSKDAGKSLSQIVADYFRLLQSVSADEDVGEDLTPRVRGLFGVLGGDELSREDYRRHLEEKYQ